MNKEAEAQLVELFQSKWWHAESTVKNRFDAGDLKIEFAPDNWRKDWYQDPYFNRSVPITFSLAETLPDVKLFSLYYLPEIDFHHIEFAYNSDVYIVQWYKVHTLFRGSDQKHIGSFGEGEIASFFRSGRYASSPHWYESSFANPFALGSRTKIIEALKAEREKS